MKKLITILSSLSLVTTSTFAVVACATDQSTKNDEKGKVILNSVKNLDKDLGYIPNPTEESVLTSFIEQNKGLLVEGTTISNFYILINGTSATINGSNDLERNSIYSIDASSSIEVTFSITEVTTPTEKIKLNSLDLNLAIGTITNTNYATIQNKFFDVNKTAFAAGVTPKDFFITLNESSSTAVITGTNNSKYFTNKQEDGVTVSYVIDTSGQFKISDHQSELVLEMGSFDKGITAKKLKPLLTQAFLDKNSSILPTGTTVENLYIATAKIDINNKTAWITGSNSQEVISSQETDGVQVTFTYNALDLTKLGLETSFNAESNEDKDIINAFVKVNSSHDLDASKLQVTRENNLIYISSNDQEVYTGKLEITVGLLIKLQDLSLAVKLGDIQENTYVYILNKFVEINQKILEEHNLSKSDLQIDVDSITTTSATLKANKDSKILSQSSVLEITFNVNDTRTELDSTLQLVTILGELDSNASSEIINKFVELNQSFFTNKNATAADLWISSDAGITTQTGSKIQASKSSNIFKSVNGGIEVSFTIKAFEKVELSKVDGVNFDLKEITVATKGDEGKKRPKNWDDIVGLFLDQNKSVPILNARVANDFANLVGTSFSYNNKTENSKSMTINFLDKHPFFTGTINITYVLK